MQTISVCVCNCVSFLRIANMGGTKRKIDIENIERKDRKTVAFTKRKEGLFRKASKLCLLSPATRIAILATPLTANSHASFYSLGHPSVDHVVSTLLNGQPPANQLENNSSSGLGFWWEDRGFDVSENVDELKEAVDAVSSMLNYARLRLDDAVKSNQRGMNLVIHQEKGKEILRLGNEDTNQIHKFEQGETSASASLLKNEEDTLHIDDYFTDFHIDPF